MVFKSDMSILAAPRLCICDLCKQSYGSCSLFETYHLDVQNLKSTTVRSNEVSDEDHVVSEELVIPESLCAVAASENSFESVWFMCIESDQDVATHQIMNDYGHIINEGEKFIQGKYLEKVATKRDNQTFKLMNKVVLFYQASIDYPFVNFEIKKDTYLIWNPDYPDVIAYMERIPMY